MGAVSSMVHVRVDDKLKSEATETLTAMGLSVFDVVRVFLMRVVAEKQLPFALKVPNPETHAAMQPCSHAGGRGYFQPERKEEMGSGNEGGLSPFHPFCTSVYLHNLQDDLKYTHCTSIKEIEMHTTRAFKNGNSQAVRIPADIAYERTDIELEIERKGDEIRIRPARRSLAGVLAKFASFSPDFMAEGRGDQDQAERDGI